MTEYQIRTNYRLAINKAKELDEIAESIRVLANQRLIKCLDEVRAQWSGEASNVFSSKLNALVEKTAREADNVKRIADTVRWNAERTYNTEMRALEISRNRTYR